MYVITPENITRTLGKPVNWDEELFGECAGLPVVDVKFGEMPCMISLWAPTQEELELLNDGHVVQLYVYGVAHPPVAIEVCKNG